MAQELRKIKTQVDAVQFCFWLQEHPEVTSVQGMEVMRGSHGGVYGFRIDSMSMVSVDIHELMAYRRVFNDWIDRKVREGQP